MVTRLNVCLLIQQQPEFNINADYFDFESNTKRTLESRFVANGVDDAGVSGAVNY